MHKTFVPMVIGLCLAISQPLFADPLGCHGGLKSMLESIKLDDTQKEKIKPILDQLKTDVNAAGTQMNGIEAQINQQDESATMDQSAVDTLIDKKTHLIGDIMKAKSKAKNQVFAILNDQQKKQLQDSFRKLEQQFADEYKRCHDDA